MAKASCLNRKLFCFFEAFPPFVPPFPSGTPNALFHILSAVSNLFTKQLSTLFNLHKYAYCYKFRRFFILTKYICNIIIDNVHLLRVLQFQMDTYIFSDTDASHKGVPLYSRLRE